MQLYFNPLPPHGGRPSSASVNFRSMSFQSTPSTRRETTNDGRSRSDKRFQSTPSTRRETWNLDTGQASIDHFNPLPPHGGRPVDNVEHPAHYTNFNPLPPHGGRRAFTFNFSIVETFQSTPSTRRETLLTLSRDDAFLFQSTPSTRRETLSKNSFALIIIFQSTPSTRRETQVLCILAPRCEHFNPLPPHGGRRQFSLETRKP